MLSNQSKTFLCFHKQKPIKEIKDKEGNSKVIKPATRNELKKIFLDAERHLQRVKSRPRRSEKNAEA